MRNLTPDQIAHYRGSLADFADDMPVHTATGLRRFGDVKVPAQRDMLVALEPAAIAAMQGRPAPIRRFWLEATKGYAKSWMIALTVLWMIAFSRRMLRIQIAAADKDQAAEVRMAAVKITQAMPWLANRVRVDKWQIVCSDTEALAEIIPADEAGSQGALPDALFVDELTCIVSEEFVFNLLDNSEKVPHGLVMLAMNAGNVDSWQYRLREAVQSQPERWQFRTITGPAPYHDPAGIEDARRRSTASRFNRLFGGVWSSGGDCLDVADIEAAITLDGPIEDYAGRFGYVAGLDLGVKRDHAALVVLAVDSDTERMYLADCQSSAPEPGGEVDLLLVKDCVLEASRRFRGLTIGYDPHQASFMSQSLRRDGVNMLEVPFIGKHLDTMASTLLQAFRGRTVELYREPDLITDLCRLQIVEKSYGYKLTAPSDKILGHADRAIALSIAIPIAADAMRCGPSVMHIEEVIQCPAPRPLMLPNEMYGW